MADSKTPELEFFDLDGFIINLNRALADSEEPIKLDKFVPDEPKKDSLLYRMKKRKIEARGRYVLNQLWEGIHPLNPEGKIGYIFVETGYNISSDYGGGYEKIILRLNRFRLDHNHLELSNGKIIRKCGIEFLKEMEEGEYPDKDLDKVRTDYLLSWGGLVKVYVNDPAVKRYLRIVLPSEWFSGGGIAPEYRMHEARRLRAKNPIK